jgi:hypothetical protein
MSPRFSRGNSSDERRLPIMRLPSAPTQYEQADQSQLRRELENHWHPQELASEADAVSLGLPRITLSGVLDSTTLVPTYTAVGNSLVVRVKIAARTDRYPTPDEVRAMSSDTTSPFTRAFAAIGVGQTSYAAAFGYDTAGNESNLAQAHLTAGTTGASADAPIWLFCQRGQGYWQDRAGTVVANNGDKIDRWDDQSGNNRHLVSHDGNGAGPDGTGWAGSLDYRPTRDANTDSITLGFSDNIEGWTDMRPPPMIALNEVEILIGIRAYADPDILGLGLCAMRDGNPADQYPDATGHIQVTFGLETAHDAGNPTTDLTNYNVYNVSGSNLTRELIARLNGDELLRYALVGPENFDWNGGDTFVSPIGPSFFSGPQHFRGWCRDLVIFNGICSDTQRAAWLDYLAGNTDTPPTLLALSYTVLGGDVEVTAMYPSATTVKIAASTGGSPTDADIRATDALDPPFSKIFPAPEVGESLSVGAFAYAGTTESSRANLSIPGTVVVNTSEGDLILVEGDGITIDTTTTPGSIIITAASGTTMVPTLIESGDTFTVPAKKQALYALSIDVEGTLDVEGALVPVG